MKSPYKVTSNIINGEKMYAVYRLKGVRAVDPSDKYEYFSGYITDKEVCERLAEELNNPKVPFLEQELGERGKRRKHINSSPLMNMPAKVVIDNGNSFEDVN